MLSGDMITFGSFSVGSKFARSCRPLLCMALAISDRERRLLPIDSQEPSRSSSENVSFSSLVSGDADEGPVVPSVIGSSVLLVSGSVVFSAVV